MELDGLDPKLTTDAGTGEASFLKRLLGRFPELRVCVAHMGAPEYDTFLGAVEDLLTIGGLQLVRLGVSDMPELVRAAQAFNLDFDDAYQYAIAERYELTLVSFDVDFDRTERQRRTPGDDLGG